MTSRQELPAWFQSVAEVAATVTVEMLPRHAPSPPAAARRSAVLMLFGETDGQPDLLFTERSHQMRSHPGQVSFPGGRAEPGDDGAAGTALREAAEEVGILASGVEVFGQLPPLWIPPSNSAVTTVLAWWREPHHVVAVDPDEVAAVLRVPVAQLMEPQNRFMVRHPSGWTGPAFDIGHDLVLWGFTAAVVAWVLAAAGWEKPWDTARMRGLPIGANGGLS